MLGAEEIVARLQRAADEWILLAFAWHMVVFAASAALAAGWRPSRRSALSSIAMVLASVGAVAFATANPFNGAVFAALAISLFVAGRRASLAPVARGTAWETAAGICMIGFGFVYPHFVAGQALISRLVGAPLGVVPCPSLSVAIGFALLGGGIARGPSAALSFAGLFYGAFGALVLGVNIDWVLAGGAALLFLGRLFSKTAAPDDGGTASPIR